MDYHLDRRIVLSPESELKNLYEWSLHEVDERGKKVGRDMIPWEWDLHFTVSELALTDTLAIEPQYRLTDEGEPTVRKTEVIRASLLPIDPWRRADFPETAFSMFGTDRTISDISLSIIPLGDSQEYCRAWGSVSYTAGDEFGDDTTPDTLIFYLHVQPATFAKYAAMLRASEFDAAALTLGRVDGFYSQWSPGISTGKIKVLTGNGEQAIATPDDCGITPPRLGTVRHAEFYVRSIRKMQTSAFGDDEVEAKSDDVQLQAPSQRDDRAPATRKQADTDARVVRILSWLRVASWIIVALLVVIALK